MAKKERDEAENPSIILSQPKEEIRLLPNEKSMKNYLNPSTLNLAQRKGVRNQLLIVGGILFYCMTSSLPIGFSVVLLPQLFAETSADLPNKITIDMDMGTWIASIPVLATPFGSFLSGILSDSFGRRNTVILSVCPMIISWCIMALAQSYYVLLLGRFISGFSVAFVSGPVQVYISELTEPKLRRFLNFMPACMYYTGILLVYILGALFHWRVVCWLGALLLIISIIPLCCIPESPSWLVRYNKEENALKVLKTLRGHGAIAEDEIRDMKKRLTVEIASSKTKKNIIQLCCRRSVYKPLIIVTVFNCLQILTGNFILINYANSFIEEIGAKVDKNYSIIATAITRDVSAVLLCSIVTLLPVRKVIMGSGFSSGVLSLVTSIFLYGNGDRELSTFEGYLVCAGLLMYIIFNTPFLIIPGIIIGELLPAKVRGRCAGYVYTVMNIALFVVIKSFPYFQNAVKLRGVFLMFTFANLTCTILVYLFLPDTTSLTLNEIEDYFKEDNWLWISRNTQVNSRT